MLRIISTRLADNLYMHCHLDPSKKVVYIYGIELFLSTFSSIFSILIISSLIWTITDAILFLFIYIGLRAFCGGYHAKTYGRCFISTNLTFILVNLFAHSCSSFWLISILFLLSSITIFLFAPICSTHHPLSPKKLLLNRHIALSLLVFLAAILICSILVWQLAFWHSLSVASLAAVAVFMIFSKLQERSKEK